MTSRSRLLIPALRELGIAALYQYGVYQFAMRSGLLRRRTKPYLWSDRPLESWLKSETSVEQVLSSREPFFFEPGKRLQEALQHFPSEDVRQEAGEILAGRFRLFGGAPVPLGNPPDWGKVPLADEPDSVPLDRHWTRYGAQGRSDLRLLWEPARFGSAFILCRAYQFTGQRRYADGVCDLFTSWLDSNQPNCGPHWVSGQESALRILALIFIWHALADFLEASPTRAGDILVALAVSAERIPPTLSYARAQKNNHLLTEAVGLYSVGLLMPWFERSAEWKKLGRRWLTRALEDQVFEDGGYIQYSTNYQRLALNAGLWAARLAEIHGEPLPETTLDALQRMTEFLGSMTDPQNGTTPNWGHNDGSNILLLSSCEHADYRPVLQAATRAFTGESAFGPGPWDEMSVWLGLPVKGEAGMPRSERTDFPHAGLYLVRGESSRATLRCARFTARPAHSDQLHLDLWWNQHNLARDAGTYRYAAPPPWENAFAGAAAHNSLVADGREPMDRAGRFLWLNWSNARFLGRWQAEDGSVQALAAEHPMRDGFTHRRSVVQAGGSLWVVLDELLDRGAATTHAGTSTHAGTGTLAGTDIPTGAGAPTGTDWHRARLAWSLIDWPWELEDQSLTLRGEEGPMQLRVTPGMDDIALYRAGERVAGERQPTEDPAVLGWWSPTYGYKEPALTLVATVEGSLPLRMTSWWRLGDVEPQDLMLNLENLAEDPLLAFLSRG
ncbi:MAG: alginate lyase family protein [Chloroflexi bacterium]|nr:alginate lyase family protein [Chloroflexota bacterium]